MIIAMLLALSTVAHAEDDPIRSNRPGQSIGAHAVGNGIFQVETGFDRLASSGAVDTSRTEIIEGNFRYGVNERFEVLFNTNMQWDHVGSTAQNGISTLDPGVNFALIPEADGLVPALALQTRFHLFTNVSAPYKAQEVAPSFLLASEHELGNDWGLNLNAGMDYDGNGPTPRYIYIANLGFPIHGKLAGFVEAYGNMKNSAGKMGYDTGVAWLLNNDLQVDLSGGGGGNNRGVDDNFVSIGLSWRKHTKQLAAKP